MSAYNARELGRLVYKYGGVPVASFFSNTSLSPVVTDAMFIDATHDNEPGHILNRCVQDVLPNTALTAIASCASGSCRGYDELVPHRVRVVTLTPPIITLTPPTVRFTLLMRQECTLNGAAMIPLHLMRSTLDVALLQPKHYSTSSIRA